MNVPDSRAFLSPILIGRATQLEYLRRRLTADPCSRGRYHLRRSGHREDAARARSLRHGRGRRVSECFRATVSSMTAALPYSLLIDLLRNHLLTAFR